MQEGTSIIKPREKFGSILRTFPPDHFSVRRCPQLFRLRAYTLIELVIVIALLWIMSYFLAPRITNLFPIQRETAAFKILGDIRYVRSRSIAEQVVHGIQFSIQPANNYRAFRINPGTLIKDPSRPNIDMLIQLNAGEFGGVRISAVNFQGGPEVRFDSTGTPLDINGGTLTTTGTVTIQYQGATQLIQVAPITGRVTIQ